MKFDKCMKTYRMLLTKKECEDYFNNNDMNMLIDICLSEIYK